MKNIIIRTLGGKGIGYGHFYRCLSLAKAIRLGNKETNITFIINDELIHLLQDEGFIFILSNNLENDEQIIDKINIDLFIFDSYLGDDEYLRKIKIKSKLMLIDDNNDIYDSAIPDIIYNGNIHAKNLRYQDVDGQVKLLGTKYLIMKEEYWNKDRNLNLNKEGFLITTGGTDEHGITLKIIEQIKDIQEKIKVIIGPGFREDYIEKIKDIKADNIKLIYKPKSLKQHISSSLAVITAGGSTVYEVLSQNTIPIIFSIADNQDLICKELSYMGIDYIGKYPNINYTGLLPIIKTFEGKKVSLSDEVFDMVNVDGANVIAGKLL